MATDHQWIVCVSLMTACCGLLYKPCSPVIRGSFFQSLAVVGNGSVEDLVMVVRWPF